MEVLMQVPFLDQEKVKVFLEANNLSVKHRQTRSARTVSDRNVQNIEVIDVQLKKNAKSRGKIAEQTLTAEVKEVPRSGKRSMKQEKHHRIEIMFGREKCEIKRVVCLECGTAGPCGIISSLLYWLLLKQQDLSKDKENVMSFNNHNAIKPCYVQLTRLNMETLEKYSAPEPKKIKLQKLEKPVVIMTPAELENAQKLCMASMIREFQGDDVDDFLRYCTECMTEQVCASIQRLTVDQADTELWHALRVGRITASRIREASRCTMTGGSLTNNIMGLKSGFSFAMKRGTDLEGHVFRAMQKEYPDLREVGLVLDPQFPWMGASPDGLGDEFVLEIKCPYTEKTHATYVDVKQLSPKYFAQIQLQMHMTHRSKALLAVAALDFESTGKVTKVWIDYDPKFVKDIMGESFEFWRKAIFKALLRKRNSKKP